MFTPEVSLGDATGLGHGAIMRVAHVTLKHCMWRAAVETDLLVSLLHTASHAAPKSSKKQDFCFLFACSVNQLGGVEVSS